MAQNYCLFKCCHSINTINLVYTIQVDAKRVVTLEHLSGAQFRKVKTSIYFIYIIS